MCCSVTRGPRNVECLEAIGLAASTDGGRAADVTGNKYRQMMRLRDVHFMALFILIYVGTEVTLGGTFSVPVLSVSRSVEEICSLVPGCPNMHLRTHFRWFVLFRIFIEA